MNTAFAALLIALSIAPSVALAETAPTPDAILKAAPASDWRALSPEDLMVMDMAGGARVVVLLADSFAPVHVRQIRKLVRAGWYDGVGVERVQDDYVVQWGDDAKPVPPSPQAPPEYDRPAADVALQPLPYRDTYASQVGYVGAWPVAEGDGRAWLTHCYAMVGVARDLNPDTGNGSELYAVLGQAPRGLDRNIAVAGRVIAGMDRLAALPRGTAAMGFYASKAERTPVLRVRMAADMPAGERPAFQVLDPASATFRAWVHLKANRKDSFFLRPAGAIDLCSALPPVRPAP